MDKRLLQRIRINPKVMVGKPVIRGTRIPVELIVRMQCACLPVIWQKREVRLYCWACGA